VHFWAMSFAEKSVTIRYLVWLAIGPDTGAGLPTCALLLHVCKEVQAEATEVSLMHFQHSQAV